MAATFLGPLLIFFLVTSIPTLVFSKDPYISLHCNKADRRALIKVFDSLGILKPSLLAKPCCGWPGVSCDPANDRVTFLDIFDSKDPAILPTAIGELHYLRVLNVRNLLNLTGSIPDSITELKNLITLDLSHNSLSGPIPAFLSKLTSLTYLDLSYNKFSGSIPPSLWRLTNLGGLHLENNRLTGKIPDSFGGFYDISLYLSNNYLSGPIPQSLGSPNYGNLYLNGNRLTGDAFFLLLEHKVIYQLDLSRNLLSFDLTKVKFPANLTSLDLSHNKIYGGIPGQINHLSHMDRFNVSYNELCGRIPRGKVTAKFDKYSYVHNKCLCGAPLAACPV